MREYWFGMRRAAGGDAHTYVLLLHLECSLFIGLPTSLLIMLSSLLPYGLILYIPTGPQEVCAAGSRP